MKHGPYDLASSFYPPLIEDPFDDWGSSDLFHDPFYQYSPPPAMSGMFNIFRRRKPQDTSPLQSSATSPATLQSPPNQNTQPSSRAAHSLAAPHNHSSSSSSSSSVHQHQHPSQPSSRLSPNIDELTQPPSAQGTSEDSLSTSADGKYFTPASTPSESNREPTHLAPPGASLTTIANNFIAGQQQASQSLQRPSSNSTTPNGTIPKPDNSANGQLAQIRSSLDAIFPKVKQFSGTHALFFFCLVSRNPIPKRIYFYILVRFVLYV